MPRWSRFLKLKRTVAVFLLAMYGLAFAVFPLPRLVRMYIFHQDLLAESVFDYHSMTCVVESLYKTNMIGFLITVSVWSVMLIYFYARIHHLVRINERKLQKHYHRIKGDQKKNPSTTSRTTMENRNRKHIKIVKTMCIIFLMYIGSQVPIPLLLNLDPERKLPHIWYAPWVMFIWVSSSTNWVIYGLLNREFMAAYKQIFKCQLKTHSADGVRKLETINESIKYNNKLKKPRQDILPICDYQL